MKYYKAIFFTIIIFGVTFSSGCINLNHVQEPVQSDQISYDGNSLDSGIKDLIPEGYVVSTNVIDRYNALIKKYNKKFTPVLRKNAGVTKYKDNLWIIDREHFTHYRLMITWENSNIL